MSAGASQPITSGSDPDEVRIALDAARRGDHAAFACLVDRYQSEVRACIVIRIDQAVDADDIAQEVFIVAFRRLEDFDGSHPFGAWLRGIALNLVRNHRRRHRERPVGGSAELELIAASAIEHLAAGGEHRLAERLEDCLQRLGERERDLLNLRYAEGLSLVDVCARRGLKHSALTMSLHRARERLRLCLGLDRDGGTTHA
jgi:RNA polymerase sigma-70 factor, ECF subfamily